MNDKILNEKDIQQFAILFPIVKKFIHDYLDMRNIPCDIVWINL